MGIKLYPPNPKEYVESVEQENRKKQEKRE
jgi:hypothetical protein